MSYYVRFGTAALAVMMIFGLSAPALAQTTTVSEPSRAELEVRLKALQLHFIALLQIRKGELERQRTTLETQLRNLQLQLIGILQQRLAVLQNR